jgi:hypothetical protein
MESKYKAKRLNIGRTSSVARLALASTTALEALEQRVLMSTTITKWSFDNNSVAANNAPAPSVGTGTASSVGMIGGTATGEPPYPTPGASGTTDASVIEATSGGSEDGSTGNEWKVVGGPGKPANGWNTAADIGTQGAQFLVPTSGYSNISLSFDWGVSSGSANGQLAVEYTLDANDPNTVWTVAPSISLGANTNVSGDGMTQVLSNSTPESGGNGVIVGSYFFDDNNSAGGKGLYQNGLTADFSGVTTGGPNGTGANNDPYFGVRLVNAATGTAVVSAAGTGAPSNTSANWRFDDVAVSGTALGGPTITASPASTEIVNGATATFTARATGTPNPTVQWYEELPGQTMFTPDTTDAGNTTTQLQVVGSAGNNGAQYYAQFTSNGVSSPSGTATLTVDQPPNITTQPTAQTVAAGAYATFTAAATGTPAPAVQWYSNGTDSNTGGTPIANATSPTYQVLASTALSGTYYYAVFTNTDVNAVVHATATQAVELTASGTTIAAWNFDNLSAGTNLTPAPSSGTGSAESIGMTEPGITPGADPVANATGPDTSNIYSATGSNGGSSDGSTSNVWRIVGTNGWNSGTAIGTQGAQFLVPTTGYNSIQAKFDFYPTTQGEENAEVEYTTDGVTWTPVPAGDLSVGSDNGISVVDNSSQTAYPNSVAAGFFHVSGGQGWYNGLTVNLGGSDIVSSVGDNANFGIRIVNASTGTDDLAAAGTALNNTSGNWRLDEVQISGTPLSAPPGDLTDPMDATVGSGETATFTAAAGSGYPVPTVQWYEEPVGATQFTPDTADAGNATDTLSVLGSAATNGTQYEAVFTNPSAPEGVSTTAATLRVTFPPPGPALAQWTFTNTQGPIDASPAPTLEGNTTLGTPTLTPLGMANDYNNGTSSDDEDIVNSPTTSTSVTIDNPDGSDLTNITNEDTWRVRGLATGGQNNGWSNAAPEYTQGAEVDVPASGYDNFALSFDWYSTTQGVRDLQVQYYDPVQGAWINQGAPYIASSDDFYGVSTNVNSSTGTGTPTPVVVDLQGIPDLSGVSTLKLRMVSAYDPSLPLIDDGNANDSNPHGQYASAAVYAVNEQQELNFLNVGSSSPQFTLTYDGQTTSVINYSEGDADLTSSVGSAGAIASALNALPAIQVAGGVTVINPAENPFATGAPDDYTVIFNDPNNVAEDAITADASNNPTTGSNGLGGGTITVQASANGVVQYNNTSGNWRFDNITVTGDQINNAPTVSSEPANATWITGGISTSVSFTASAFSSTESTDPINVTWYEILPGGSATAISSSDYSNGATSLNSSGDESSTLTLTSSDPAVSHNGTLIYAVFSNSASPSATTTQATLSVVPPVAPTVSLQPVSVSVVEGGTAVFTASETGGSPAPTVQWQETDANGVYQNLPVTAVVDTTGTTTVTSTLTLTADVADSHHDFRAVFYSAVVPDGVDTNASPVPPAELVVLPVETPIAQWTFPTAQAAPYNSPVPSVNYFGAANYETDNTGTGAALTTVGFPSPGNTATNDNPDDDVTSSPGAVITAFSENTWRIRNTLSSGTSQGWDKTAPDDTQGAEIDVDTTGYSNIYMTFDWYSTNQGIRDLQEEYNTGGGWVLLGSPFVAVPNDYYGASSATSTSHIPVVFDLTQVPAAANNPDLGLRLVSAYDPTVLNAQGQPYEYTSATVTNNTPVQYNGTSGNWRFGDISIYATPDWLSPASAFNSTWNPANNTLTVTGAATITADPGSDTTISPTAEPNIAATGSLAALSFTPSSGTATDFHISGITLTNGASAIETSLDAADVAAGTNASNHATNHDAIEVANVNNFDVTGGLFDATDNDVILHYPTGDGSAALTAVQNDLVNGGFDGGAYDGTSGLTSSAAGVVANTTGATGLGIIDNNDPNGFQYSAANETPFDGESFSDTNEILVKYTYNGDAFFEGTVNNDGVLALEQGLSNTKAGILGNTWLEGNFDYSSDGSIGNNEVLFLEAGLSAVEAGAPTL